MTSRPLEVAFDATPAISGSTGIARYVTHLGSALEQQGATLRRFAIGRRSFPCPPNTRHLAIPARLVEAWWRAIPWPPVERLVGTADVVHATGLSVPASRLPMVVTVHDIAALRHPELHPHRHVRQQRAQLDSLGRAAVIVTVSSATADDLAELGVAADRLVVTPLGLPHLPRPRLPAATEALPPRFLLTVGETSPRKAYDVVLRALSRLGSDLSLVIAGPPAGDEQRLSSLGSTLGLSGRVTRLGAVSDAVLAALYERALALCFPSVAEGFGLPVLEAMAAGLPILASDIPATRELAGDAAVYLPPSHERAWADAIESVVSDGRLRDALGRKGRERAAGFTWERTATATLEAYRLALEVAP